MGFFVLRFAWFAMMFVSVHPLSPCLNTRRLQSSLMSRASRQLSRFSMTTTSQSANDDDSSFDNDAVNGQKSPAKSSSLPTIPPNAHRMVLMRHGESEFNNANIFTGWCDVALTPRGVVEAGEAGQVFASHNVHFRKCHASLLTRSIVTAHRSLEMAGISYTPVEYDWRLNERHYGALQGLSKERTAQRLGKPLVMRWRRSYDARPPLMTPQHPHYDIINNDVRYKQVQIPLGESLLDCQNRVMEAWNDILQECSDEANNVDEQPYTLLVAHANTLRALVMHLDDIASDQIEGLNIPTAIPFYYDVCKSSGNVISTQPKGKFRGEYMTDERTKFSFLERRRAANDPWLWALHDDQVDKGLLLDEVNENDQNGGDGKGLVGIEDEAARNTELFAPATKGDTA